MKRKASQATNGNGHARISVEAAPVLITGGAGFIGTNLAHRLASAGQRVLIYDNLSRPGTESNLAWLLRTHGSLVAAEQADVRDAGRVAKAVARASAVFHFAAQVAVTTSLVSPRHDFDVNVRGTLNVLEGLRARPTPVPLLFTSTNKVYGDLPEVALEKQATRYSPRDPDLRSHGVGERTPLCFHSPYGCSKGAADQYVLDFGRCFNLPTVVFRMSCIYGLHQMGNEDQGWVAHFLLQVLRDERITIYGDGLQVRDILFADDLINAMLLTVGNIERTRGHAFNVGGGPERTVSLVELLKLLGRLHGRRPEVELSDWRPADQRYYVSDTRKLQGLTGWQPANDVEQGVQTLYAWLRATRGQAPALAERPVGVTAGSFGVRTSMGRSA